MKQLVADLARQTANLVAVPVSIAVALAPLRVDVVTAGEELLGGADPLVAAAPGVVFIWLPIFAWTLLYAVWQALPAQRKSPLLRRVGWWTASAAVGSALATVCFARADFAGAWVCAVAVVTSLLQVERGTRGATGDDHGLVRAPFGLQLGWMCMAMLLHSAQVLHVLLRDDVNPMVSIFAAIAGLVLTASLGIAFVMLRDNRWAGVAIVWGLLAIAVERHDVTSLAFLAALGAVVVVVAVLSSLLVLSGPSPQPA